MSQILIRRALEKRLSLLSPALPTAYDNVEFDPSANPSGFQIASLLPARTENPTVDQRLRIESGIFQVTIYMPPREGANAAETRAQLVRSHFPAGLTLVEGGIKVRITRTPSIAAALVEPGWYGVPISATYQSIIP